MSFQRLHDLNLKSIMGGAVPTHPDNDQILVTRHGPFFQIVHHAGHLWEWQSFGSKIAKNLHHAELFVCHFDAWPTSSSGSAFWSRMCTSHVWRAGMEKQTDNNRFPVLFHDSGGDVNDHSFIAIVITAQLFGTKVSTIVIDQGGTALKATGPDPEALHHSEPPLQHESSHATRSVGAARGKVFESHSVARRSTANEEDLVVMHP